MFELLLASTALNVSAVDSPWQLVALNQATAAATHEHTRAMRPQFVHLYTVC
jgi:hypothetical protein